MVTREELWTLLGRRPFQPFRVLLTGGEAIDITRTAQAVVTPRELIVGMPDEHFRWVRLERIERVDVFELRQRA